MLNKLLKYELKATGRIFLPLFLALLLFAGITRLISPLGPEKFDTIAMISKAIYTVIMVGMFVMTFIMMIQRFHKNLLSDEGYLMHTLPVKPWKHIVSKLLVSMLWMVTSVIIAMISILIIAYKKGAVTEIVKGLATAHNKVIEQLGAWAYPLTFEMILVVLLFLASGILIIYASVALGHLFNRHKMLASFGAFVGLNALSQIYFGLISSSFRSAHFANIHLSTMGFVSSQSVIQLAIGLGILFVGLLCAAYFAITNFILSKRLNLE
ncbi:hypothetical protein [Desulfosporosinus sp. Sb-LF]|uniref:hypothetical protein n=1 Tax=Desulfosporosinus sp. Sb-LF TaxID=2560027 RepID=UPI00107EF5C1|nr:hypothetical protein [Desulfosporosinus sp. Sb-LF]TGE31389.1 hypothetical protein E4K68_17530 [Desulfosporosinus sp. Sb-LF]